jgi:hypothetical protein
MTPKVLTARQEDQQISVLSAIRTFQPETSVLPVIRGVIAVAKNLIGRPGVRLNRDGSAAGRRRFDDSPSSTRFRIDDVTPGRRMHLINEEFSYRRP